MSGFFEGLYIPLWKKFGEHEIKTSAITAVWFHQHGFVNQEEKHPCVTIYLAGSNQVRLTGEELDKFRKWWQQEKENCGIDENS